MSADRKLLELAAKAAGLDAWWSEPFGFMCLRSHGNGMWNPLTNDGDALRLAAKLLIQVYPDADGVEVFQMEIGYMAEPSKGDLPAAIRRAIVKVAAEIGRNMK